MHEIKIWKKIIICVGVATQIISYFKESSSLLIIGGISIIIGTLAIFMIK